MDILGFLTADDVLGPRDSHPSRLGEFGTSEGDGLRHNGSSRQTAMETLQHQASFTLQIHIKVAYEWVVPPWVRVKYLRMTQTGKKRGGNLIDPQWKLAY